MAEAGFDFPDFRRRQHAGEGRILTQPLGVIRFRAKQCADLVHRAGEDLLPFGIAAQQRRGGGILFGPAREVGLGESNQCRTQAQTFGHAPCQFQTHLIDFRVVHAARFLGMANFCLKILWSFLPVEASLAACFANAQCPDCGANPPKLAWRAGWDNIVPVRAPLAGTPDRMRFRPIRQTLPGFHQNWRF